jgi:hypothetical protein
MRVILVPVADRPGCALREQATETGSGSFSFGRTDLICQNAISGYAIAMTVNADDTV